MEPEERSISGKTQIHNVQYYTLEPRSIERIALNKSFHKLAVARCEGYIEIWDIQHVPYLEKTIIGQSVEGIVWAGNRLFTGGLSGQLVEWDLEHLKMRRTTFVTGNAIWCLDINPLGTELVVGTEEGYINILDITNNHLQYKNLFDKQEGRVVCCQFDKTGKFVVTGSLGAIRIWNVDSGHAVQKMTLKRAKKSDLTIVWTLKVLSDFTIISGDSTGQIIVWDGRNGSQIESHQVLKADVLTLDVNDKEDMFVCSGVEPIIRIYSKTLIKQIDMENYRWIKYLQRNAHDFEVKSLVLSGHKIYTGGIDGYIACSSTLKMNPNISKYGPFLQHPCATIAQTPRLLLLRYHNYLELWHLGSAFSENEEISVNDKVIKNGKKLLCKHLTLNEKSTRLLQIASLNKDPILCATLSPDGKFLCYSTHSAIRLFHLTKEDSIKPKIIKQIPDEFCVATHIQFTANSESLFLVNSRKKEIRVFTITSKGDLQLTDTVDVRRNIKDFIHLFTISETGNYIAAASTGHTIAVWLKNEVNHYEYKLSLPQYTAATTAVAFNDKEDGLIITFTDGRILEYNLLRRHITYLDSELFVSKASGHTISNILVDKRNPNIVILHNDTKLFVVERHLVNNSIAGNNMDHVQGSSPNKRKKGKFDDKSLSNGSPVTNNPVDSPYALRLKTQLPYEHLIFMSWLSCNELVAVSVNPISLTEQLPSTFKPKKFGVE